MKNKVKGLITLIIAIMVFIPTSVFAHQVTFNTNEGSSISSQEVDDGEKATRPETNPEKDGYEFAGWYSDEELTELFDFDESITSDTTIYAKWLVIVDSLSATITLPAAGEHPVFTGTSGDNTKYTITEVRFMDNETTLTETDTFESGKGYSIYVLVRPTTGKTISSSATFLINGESATYYSAISDGYGTKIYTYSYTVPVPTYEVTFNTNGGSAIDSQEIEEGETVVRPATDPTRTGYRFAGWYSDSGLEHEYDFTTPITVATTIYAKWNQEYTLTVLTNQLTCQVEYKSVKYDSGYTIKAIAGEEIRLYAKASENFIFNSATSTNATVTNNGSIGRIITMPASDATVTFNFDRVYTITYVIEYDNTGPLVWDYAQAINGNVVNPGDPERDGYEFGGWYTDSTFATKYNFNTVVTSDKTIYAKWNKIHTVTFNTNGGNSIDNQDVVNGLKATQPSDPTRSGYVFDGWYSDSNLTIKYNFNNQITSDTTIYAKWIKVGNNYKLFNTSSMYDKYIIEASGDITSILYSTLNNACSAASSLSDKYIMVYIPNGNYKVSEKSFMVCSNVYVVLEDNAKITKTTGDNLGIFRVRNANTNNALIYGGTLDLNKKGKNVIEIMNSTNVRVERVNIKNGTNAGIRIDNSQNVDLNDVNINNNANYAVHETNSTLRVTNSNINKNGTGIYANGTTLTVERTIVESNTKDGISLNNATFTSKESQYNNNVRGIYSLGSKVTSESNKVYSNSGSGIVINDSSTATIYKTNSYSNAGQGIEIKTSTANVKKSNVYSNGRNGIYTISKSKVTLKESKVYGNGENGIQVIGGSLLYANSNAQNEVTKNNYSGISASGKGTKIYVDGNTVTNNGIKPKISDEGEVAHGIGVTENAYGEITNNKLNDNKGCGISVFNYGTTKIVGNEINRNGRHGIGARNNNTITEITKNTINNNVLNGVLMSYKTNGPINNNIIQHNGNLGLSVVDGSIVTATSNNISYNQMNNVSLSNAKNVSGGSLTLKANNIIEGSVTGHGIAVSGATSLIINAAGNKIQSNKQNGISVIENSKLNISATTTIYGNGETGIHIKDSDAQIKGAKIRKNGGYGVFLNNAGNLIIWKSYIENNKSYGFNLTGRQSIAKITKCEINGNDIAIMANNKVSANRISNNKIRNNKSTAIFVKNGSYVRELLGNTIENNNGYGIYANNSKIRLIKSNNILSNKNTGIVIRNGAVANEISYNNIKNNAYEGIYVNSASVGIIKYNNMVANGEVGILAKAKAKIDSIYRNAINNHTKYGIASYSSTLTSVTKSNTYKGNGKKNYYKSA